MDKTNKRVQSRRDFFKEAAQRTLPIIGAIAIANIPLITKAESVDCNGGCYNTCYNLCSGTCKTSCLDTCKDGCRHTCNYSCSKTCQGSSYKKY